jgi:soluble lytic murein transglycosylase-like protein/outer membrane protein assembly factor BamD (BamD/ComL family)
MQKAISLFFFTTTAFASDSFSLQLKSHPAADQLSKAMSLNTSQSLFYLQKTIQNPLFADHGLWERALFYQRKAQTDPKKAPLFLSKAIKDIEKILSDFPSSVYIKNAQPLLAQLELSIALFEKKPEKKCALIEKSLTRRTPSAPFQNQEISAIKAYAGLCSFNPADQCTYWLKKVQINLMKAPQDYNSISGIFDKTPSSLKSLRDARWTTSNYRVMDADMSAVQNAVQLISQKNTDQAMPILTAALKDYPKSAFKKNLLFWNAFVLDQNSDKEQAQQLRKKIIEENPLSLYAVWSTQQEQSGVKAIFDPQKTEWIYKNRCEGLSYFDLQHLEKAEAFLASNLNEKAALELKEILTRDVWPVDFLNYLFLLKSKAKQHIGVWGIIAELLLRNPQLVRREEIIKSVFPFDYWAQIQKAAAEAKIDPVLLISLVKQESAFNVKAISSSGALGLSQLMPPTAFCVDASVPTQELVSEEKNLLIGARYLSQLLNQFNGNIAYALASYNAGPQAVQRWIKETKPVNLAAFLESIPYRETRDYVPAIIRNYFWYSYFLNQEVKEGMLFFWNTAKQQNESA